MSTASAVHQIRLIQTLDEFDGLALAWEELRSQAIASSIFVSHDFICAWLRSYGTGWEPFVLLAEAHDSLVGALPLCVSRTRLGRRSVCFLGDGYADYSDALIRSDSPSAYDVLADALFEKLGDWDFAHLRYLCSESQLLRSLNPKRRADWLVRSEVTMPNPYIEVVGTWPGQVSKKLSWQLKYQRRKLEKAHGEVTVSWGTTPEEVSAGLEVLYRLHRLRWESMKGSISNFTIAAARQVHASMFTQLAEKHRTLLSTLSVADRPIAVAVNLIGEDTIYYCQTAFDPEFADYSPSS